MGLSRRVAPATPVGDKLMQTDRVEPKPLIAGVPARAVAYLVDLFLVSVVTLGLWAVADRVPGMRPAPLNTPGVGQDPVILARLVVDHVVLGPYFVALWSGGRRTVGMRLLRIRVVRAMDGAAVPVAAALMRWIVLALPALVFDLLVRARPDLFGSSLALLGGALFGWPVVLIASVVLDRGRRGLHDRASGTAVVAMDARPAVVEVAPRVSPG